MPVADMARPLTPRGAGGLMLSVMVRLVLLVLAWLPVVVLPRAHAADAADTDTFLFQRDYAGRVMVLAMVDGRGPFPFVVDSAASKTVLFEDLARHLRLPLDDFRSRRVMTATGPRRLPLYRLGRVEALGRSVLLRRTVALPQSRYRVPRAEPQGLIGLEFLRGGVLAFLGEAGGVRLLPHGGALPDLDWTVLHGRPVGYGSLALDLRVGTVEIPAIVDTGAERSVVNVPAADALTAENSARYGKTVFVESANGQVGARELLLDRPLFSDVALNLPRVLVSDLPVFSSFYAHKVPAMILGADFLFQDKMAIDFRQWRLFITQAGNRPPEADD
ncbi:aspartyl protease family protein [Eilatimonas milleporae]|uniref:aspartyl protease family protein n=1 Tax=Eilatimonas milleporae TaxID=911205 RepID=UPI001472C49E|nr:aspartyl protease family protein [Eilatimonas milleporae]